VYVAVAEFAAVFIGMAGFGLVGERITSGIRERYLRAVLHQNIAFFDKTGAGEVATRISTDMNLVQIGISEKVSLVLAGIAAFVAALIISFIKSWKLTLIVFSSIVALILAMGVGGTITKKFKSKTFAPKAAASDALEETITSIRTATAFGAQERLALRYEHYTHIAESRGYTARTAAGVLMGVAGCIVYMEHALAFWQGARFISDGMASISSVITIQLALMMGGAWLGGALPHLQDISTAISAAERIFSTIDRKSAIETHSNSGKEFSVNGKIDFKNIHLAYPTRPEVDVLEEFSISIPAGEVVAIVGASGCGKSSLISLLQRFYLPLSGSISIDDHDISTLSLQWLRRQMSLVSQEPVLFSTTVYQNIEYGLVGTEHELV
jgi:ATP-binding cassette subfamily B (MDR/TAP) protein 1